MTAVTFPLRPPRLAFALSGQRWQNDECKNNVYRKPKITHNAIVYQVNWHLLSENISNRFSAEKLLKYQFNLSDFFPSNQSPGYIFSEFTHTPFEKSNGRHLKVLKRVQRWRVS